MSALTSQTHIETVETMALHVLGFIASDPERLTDFIAATGISPDDLHQRAAEREVMTAALEQLLQDEANLLVFCANAGIAPQQIARAHAALEAHQTGAAKP